MDALEGKTQTNDFLLQKNVDCDSYCILCDCTWETASHLMIWQLVLYTLNLLPTNCDDVYELLDSIISHIDQHSEGALTLGKILFIAFVWHIWAERNSMIFRTKANSSGAIMQKIIQVTTTKILYLGISLPNNIQCHWNVPPTVQEHFSKLISERSQGWRISIVQTKQDLVGVLWWDIHQLVKGRIEQALNYYEGIFRIL